MFKKKENGFSLVELSVAAAIAIGLAVVAVTIVANTSTSVSEKGSSAASVESCTISQALAKTSPDAEDIYCGVSTESPETGPSENNGSNENIGTFSGLPHTVAGSSIGNVHGWVGVLDYLGSISVAPGTPGTGALILAFNDDVEINGMVAAIDAGATTVTINSVGTFPIKLITDFSGMRENVSFINSTTPPYKYLVNNGDYVSGNSITIFVGMPFMDPVGFNFTGAPDITIN